MLSLFCVDTVDEDAASDEDVAADDVAAADEVTEDCIDEVLMLPVAEASSKSDVIANTTAKITAATAIIKPKIRP
jgi:hypothetical protein